MDIIINGTNGKSHGTFKFQYSRRHLVKPDPRFVPHNDKKLAENIVGSYFCQFLQRQYHSTIVGYTHNSDDSYKQQDVSFIENGESKGLQITELQFTRHEERKALSLRISERLLNSIVRLVIPKFPIIVNIFPNENKATIPLADVKKGKSKLLGELGTYIARIIDNHQEQFYSNPSPIWHTITHPKLTSHYRQLVLNRVPSNYYPRFYGHSNIFINYDIDDVAFDESDADHAIQAIYKKKNEGSANILLIWSDEFELATLNKRMIAEKIFNVFENSSFEEVFFMTFTNNLPMFIKSLELWALKGKRVPMKELIILSA